MTIDVPGKDRIEMSQRERDVLQVVQSVLDGKRSQAESARLLDLSPRQVRRLQHKLAARGDGVLVHGLRGRPSNHRYDRRVKNGHKTSERETSRSRGRGSGRSLG